MDYFVFIYRPGPAWVPNRSVLEQPLAGRFAHMKKLEQSGVLCLGGPFKDDTGALGVVRASDYGSAFALVSSDPAVLEGIFTAEVHPWHPSVPGVVEAKRWD